MLFLLLLLQWRYRPCLDLYGPCITTSDVVIEGGIVTATLVSATTTAFGAAQGVNCARLIGDAAAATGPITLRKIF